MSSRNGPKCGAKLRSGPGTCKLPAGWGTDNHVGWGHCRKHLGTSPSGAENARRQQVEHEVRATLVQLGGEPLEDPLHELARLAGEALSWKEQLGHKVNELTELRYEGDHGEQLRAEVVLYERAVDRLTAVLVSIAKLRLDERLVRLSESQAALVNRVISGVLAEIGLSDEQLAAARPVVAKHLRAVAREPARLALPSGNGPS
jgi:HEPN domain-containing protein